MPTFSGAVVRLSIGGLIPTKHGPVVGYPTQCDAVATESQDELQDLLHSCHNSQAAHIVRHHGLHDISDPHRQVGTLQPVPTAAGLGIERVAMLAKGQKQELPHAAQRGEAGADGL